jgi:hypothetical protein
MRHLLLGLFFVLAQWVGAQEMSLDIKLDAKGKRPEKVIVQGHVERGAWLGVSFYPYGAKNVLLEGTHQVIQVPAGRYEHGFQVADRLLGGAVEAALWEKKVPAAQCSGPCEWCQKNGYHLENQILYIYGSLAQSAARGGK